MPSEHNASSSVSFGLDKLRKEVENLRRDAAYNTHYFNPKSIRELCKPGLIRAAVDHCRFPEFKKEWICEWILKKGTLTFCILVYIEKEDFFLNILERDIKKTLDDRLPLDARILRSIAPEIERKFFDVQWQFIPVILPKREYLQIDDEYVMPFIEDHHHGDRDGSFGDIYKVTIESSMQDAFEVPEPVQEGSKIVVIRKQIRFNRDNEGFARERKCLEILQRLQHPNIVDLLCSYTYQGRHSLIFPCEDMDLDDFFQLPERYQDFGSNHTFYLAIYGLISAVEYVHKGETDDEEDFSTMIGYHHDIRPRNILVRSNTFLLADFGLAKMSEKGQSSTSVKGGGGQYMAPECINEGGHIGRAADIWSLGGVFLDIAAYMEHGPKGRSDAEDLREGDGPYLDATTTHFFSGDKLKPGVIKTIENLQQDPKDKTIRTLLLVSERMLDVQQDTRPNAHTVRRDIAYVAIKSLFRAALQGMLEWRQRSGESDAGRIWEDTWKLWAWGEEIGINGANLVTGKFQGAVPHADKDEKKLQNVLHELVRLLGSKKLLEEREPARRRSSRTSAPGQYYGEEAQKVNDRVRDLRTALPDDYGKRIKERKAYYGRFAKDPPGLPEITDDSLTPSSLHKRSLTEPLENQGILARTLTDPGSSSNSEYEKNGAIERGDEALVGQQQGSRELSGKRTDISAPPFKAKTPVKNLENVKNQIPGSSSLYSQLVDSQLFDRANRAQKPTPKSDQPVSEITTPGTSLLSVDSASRLQTAATSVNLSGLAGLSGRYVDTNKALPPGPPGMKLPDPQMHANPSSHGPFLLGTGISAKVNYTGATHEPEKTTFDIHVWGSEDPDNPHTTISCESKDSSLSLGHDLRESESAYPHTDRPSAGGGVVYKVYLLGRQIVHEQEQPQESPDGFSEGDRPMTLTTKRVITSDVCYIFSLPEDCKSFREAIWGKELLKCLGTTDIIWPAVTDARSVSVTLWKSRSSPSRLSVSFRGRMKTSQIRKVVHLQLSESNSNGRQEYQRLHVAIEPPRQDQHSAPSPKPKHGFMARARTISHRSADPPTLIIEFGSVDDCSIFQKALSQ